MNEANQRYCCTRPTLAGILMKKGIPYEIRPNAYRPTMSAWVFPMTPEVAITVRSYFRDIGQTVPNCIEKYLNGGDLTC